MNACPCVIIAWNLQVYIRTYVYLSIKLYHYCPYVTLQILKYRAITFLSQCDSRFLRMVIKYKVITFSSICNSLYSYVQFSNITSLHSYPYVTL